MGGMSLSTARALFPGAMGPEGFISCFDQLIEASVLRRRLILKGGPGVGKSTFMRRIHAALCDGETPSTLYFCSGDPDSLDAVALPQAGLLILDGTSPHIVDPQIPGARDSLINLGECLNESAMRPRLPHIRTCMADHAAASRRARAYIKAAYPLARDNAALLDACCDQAKLRRMTSALISAVLALDGKTSETPRTRSVITDAITPKGELCLLSDGSQRRVIRLVRHAGMDLTPVLKALSRAVSAAGFDVEEHLDPIAPGCLRHISIPALSTLVTTGEALASEQTFDFAACIPQNALLRHECTLEQGRTAVSQLLHRAIGAMVQAKQLHDELETFYVPNMDFSRWQTVFDQTLESLKA